MDPVTKSTASADGKKPQGKSKRRHDRFDWHTQIQVLWLDAQARGTSVTLRTCDLSAGGVSLLSTPWVRVGSRGALLLTDRPGHRFVRWVEVLHSGYTPERKSHLIGCRWIPTPENAPPVRIVESSSGPRLQFDLDVAARAS